MDFLLTGILGVFLVGLLIRQWQHQRLIKDLTRSLESRQPYLSYPGSYFLASRQWKTLLRQLNQAIEERRAVERERSDKVGQLQAMLASMQEAVLILDLNNRVVLANPSFARMFPHSELREGYRLDSALQNDPFLQYVESVRKGKQGEQVEIEFTSGGQSIWVEVTGTRIPGFASAKADLTLFVLHNITRLKQLESVRKEFVANVSHELRTPLSMVKGYVETLEDAGEDLPETQRRQFLATIHRHANRLHLLLEDLLTLSRLESKDPKFLPEPMEVETLMAQMAEDYREVKKVENRELRLDLEAEPVAIPIDISKITQVLENLLDNAIKYSPPDSLIELGTRREEAFVHGWVKDNGTGIKPKDLPHIFERFYRVDKGRSREKGGTGLGLSIVKHIVQLHGGTVQAESGLGRGTTIRFRLPRERVDAPSAAEPGSEGSGG